MPGSSSGHSHVPSTPVRRTARTPPAPSVTVTDAPTTGTSSASRTDPPTGVARRSAKPAADRRPLEGDELGVRAEHPGVGEHDVAAGSGGVEPERPVGRGGGAVDDGAVEGVQRHRDAGERVVDGPPGVVVLRGVGRVDERAEDDRVTALCGGLRGLVPAVAPTRRR